MKTEEGKRILFEMVKQYQLIELVEFLRGEVRRKLKNRKNANESDFFDQKERERLNEVVEMIKISDFERIVQDEEEKQKTRPNKEYIFNEKRKLIIHAYLQIIKLRDLYIQDLCDYNSMMMIKELMTNLKMMRVQEEKE
jgi:hypothetical protein